MLNYAFSMQYKTQLSLRKSSRIYLHFENYSDTFSGGTLTFRRQIFRKKSDTFSEENDISQTHFDKKNIVPSRICLFRKKHLGRIDR